MAPKGQKLVYSTRTDAEIASKKAPKTRRASLPPQQQTIKVMLDRKRRRGKTVTVCSGFELTPADLKDLGKQLKQFCGSGGTTKNDEIEIQGDHREKVIEKLKSLNYKAKRSGG